MTTAYSGDGITFPDNSVQATAPRVGMVNRIINGDMRIDQRNAGAAYTINNDGDYGIDRWKLRTYGGSGRYSIQQSGNVPEGFTTSAKLTVTTTDTSGTNGYSIAQHIEGYNMADLVMGTASAKPYTISFWVKSSVVGTYCVSSRTISAVASCVKTYTIVLANTWEYKTLVFPANTAFTTNTVNEVSLYVDFNLGAQTSKTTATVDAWQAGNFVCTSAQTDWISNAGATFHLTGVQLEKGSTATDFEYLDYGRQLQMCQRYFEKSYDIGTAVGTVTGIGSIGTVAYGASVSRPFLGIQFQTAKRTSATVTSYTPNTADTSGKIGGPSGADLSAVIQNAGTQSFKIYQSQVTSTSNGDYYIHWTSSAEL